MNTRTGPDARAAVHANRAAITPVGTAERRGLFLMLGATLVWPVIEMAGVSVMPRHHALQVVFLRYAAHLTLLLAVLLPLRGIRALHTRRPVLQLLRGACMFGMPICYVLAADFTSGAWVWSVFWTMPALAVVGAAFVLRERPRAAVWVAVAVGPLGAALIRGPDVGGLVGTIIAIGMAGTVAGYMVLSRMLRDEPLSASLFYTALGAIIPTALIVWRVWTPLVPADYAPVIVVGALSIIILGMFDLSLEAVPVAAGVPLLTLVPVWEAVVMVPFRNGLPGMRQIAGMVVIGLGLSLLLLGRRRVTMPTTAAPQSHGAANHGERTVLHRVPLEDLK